MRTLLVTKFDLFQSVRVSATYKMSASNLVVSAAGEGDVLTMKQLLGSGADPNLRSADGMTPLAISSFWGYDALVQMLIQYGADINTANYGTLWTPLHCATFQGHGKIVMILMEHGPDIYKADYLGRTAVDFASALDSIWPFFAAAGCKRTLKSELVQMNIVQKAYSDEPVQPRTRLLDFSLHDAESNGRHADLMSSLMGDVLAGDNRDYNISNRRMGIPSLIVWNS